MSPRRIPVSRRDRPAKAPLSRDGLVATAMRIMREEGLERVTMRRLATEHDTGPASLYVYVDNMAELHGALLDELLRELPLPPVAAPGRPATERSGPGQPASEPSGTGPQDTGPQDTGPQDTGPQDTGPQETGQQETGQQETGRQGPGWQDAVIDLMVGYTRLLWAHPALARSVLALHPSGPHYLRLIDRLLGLLEAGGVPVKAAAWGVDPLLQLATATAAEQGTRRESAAAAGEQQHLTEAVREASAEEYPHIVRTQADLFSGSGEQRLRWYFAALLAGFATTPFPRSPDVAG